MQIYEELSHAISTCTYSICKEHLHKFRSHTSEKQGFLSDCPDSQADLTLYRSHNATYTSKVLLDVKIANATKYQIVPLIIFKQSGTLSCSSAIIQM